MLAPEARNIAHNVGTGFRSSALRTPPSHYFLAALFVLSLLYPIPSFAQDDTSVCDSPGSVLESTYSSAIVSQDMPYAVYLPPCYDLSSETPYPIIYLMHGSNRDHRHFIDLGIADVMDRGISGNRFPDAVIAMPFGDWIANENRFSGTSTWSHLVLSEFMPHIETAYNVATEREHRAIGGISRGGFWAFNIAFRFPEMFQAVGGHSAFFDPGHFPAEYNPLDLARSADGLGSLRIWLDRGHDDYAFFGLDLMRDRLNTSEIPFTYAVHPEGEHDDAYWSTHLHDYLTFYTEPWLDHTRPTISHEFDTTSGDLYLPAVALNSHHRTINQGELLDVYAGLLDFDLILSESTAAGLIEHGVPLSTETTIVQDDELLTSLEADNTLYTLVAFDALSPALRVLSIDDAHPIMFDRTTYPLILSTNDPNFDAAQVGRAFYTGVTALTRNTAAQIDINGVDWAVSGILPLLSQADLLHISNEVSFAARCPASDEPVLGGFCAKDTHLDVLTGLGVDLVELSGNHNMDYNTSAYLRTLDIYEQAGMETVGGGATLIDAQIPQISTIDGTRIAHLACNWTGPDYALATETSPGAAFCDEMWLKDAIPNARSQADVVIVLTQYPEYNLRRPTPDHVSDLRWIADLGADAVIGSQAHIAQGYESYRTTDGRVAFIHYGLGNFLFDQTAPGFADFVMNEVILFRGRVLTSVLHAGTIEQQARPRPMTRDEAVPFWRILHEANSGIVSKDD